MEPHSFQFEIDSNEFSIKKLHVGFEYVNVSQPLFLICTRQLTNEPRVSVGLWYNGNICVLLQYKCKYDQAAELITGGRYVDKLHVTLVHKSYGRLIYGKIKDSTLYWTIKMTAYHSSFEIPG